jgi:hypothetical protein
MVFILDADIRVLLLLVSCCGCDSQNHKTLATNIVKSFPEFHFKLP